MKGKTKILVSSALAIAASASLITGATYAIFTSESKTDIAITSGKVNVSATISSLTLYSPTLIDSNTCVVTDPVNAATTSNFKNGGTATIDGNKLMLTNMVPGDKVTFDVEIKNNSNVTCQYRTSVKFTSESLEGFAHQFLIGLSDDGTNYAYYTQYVANWETAASDLDVTKHVSIEMPTYVSNPAWQEQTCTIELGVEAVQGNVTTTGSDSASKVYVVTEQDDIDDLFDDDDTNGVFVSGETIVLGGNQVWEAAEIETDESFIINLRGFRVKELTINAENATVNQYLDVEKLLDIQAIAGKSYHIYGKVPTAKVAQGHVVVEKTAEVGTVTLAPATSEKAKLTVNSQTTVEKVVVPTEAAGDVAVENSGIIEEIENPADKEITLFECDFSNPDDEILFCPACYKSGTTENHAEHNPIEKGGSGLKFENGAAIILREGCWLNYKMVGNKVTFDYDFDMSTVEVGDYVTFNFGEDVKWNDVKTGFKRTDSGFDLYNTVVFTDESTVLKNYTTDNMNIHMKYVLTYDEETKISTMELFLNNEEKAVITKYTQPLEKGFGVGWMVYLIPTENVGQGVNGTISNLKVTLA